MGSTPWASGSLAFIPTDSSDSATESPASLLSGKLSSHPDWNSTMNILLTGQIALYRVDFDLPENVIDKVNPKAGEFMILVYRFDGSKIELSYNGKSRMGEIMIGIIIFMCSNDPTMNASFKSHPTFRSGVCVSLLRGHGRVSSRPRCRLQSAGGVIDQSDPYHRRRAADPVRFRWIPSRSYCVP